MTIDEQKEAMRAAMRDSIFQQVQMLLKFEGAAALALQVPDTDILILAGPQDRIQGYLSTPIPYGAAGAGLRDHAIEEAARLCDESAKRSVEPLEYAQSQFLATEIRALKGTK